MLKGTGSIVEELEEAQVCSLHQVRTTFKCVVIHVPALSVGASFSVNVSRSFYESWMILV